MTDTLRGSATLTNSESAIRCTTPAWIAAVMRAAHGLWRHRTHSELLARTKASKRTVAYWMDHRRRRMSADHLVALMRAEPHHFVPAVLGDHAYASLASEIVRLSKLDELRKRQETQRALIERLERSGPTSP